MKLSANRAWVACTILMLLLFLGWSSPLSADTVFSNLSGSFCNCGGGIDSAESIEAESLAVQFTPGGNFSFTEAELGIDGEGGGGSLNVYLETNSSTGAPGTVIEQIGSDISVPGDTDEYVTADSFTTTITLSDGDSYWLVATDAAAETGLTWDTDGTQAVPLDYSETDSPDGPWKATDGALQFAIDGTPVTTTAVPEPGVLSELIPTLIGMLGLAWWAEQRRRVAQTGRGESAALR